MSKFSNMLKVIILLKSRHRIKMKELAEAIGVSERMIRKYIDDLAAANINVISVQGPHGGYELKGYNYLANLELLKEEVIALNLATQQLKENDKFSLYSFLESLNDKITIVGEEQLRGNVINSIAALSRREEKEENVDTGLLLQSASITCNKVKIGYRSVSSGITERVIRPYGLVYKEDAQYLIGHCETRQKVLTFKVARIQGIEVLEDKFEVPDDFNLKEQLSNQIGLFGEEAMDIKLIIRKPFSYSVSEKVYVADQKITWNDDESINFEARIKGKEDIIRWLLSMRTYVTVVEPLTLKKEMKSELYRILNTI